MVEIADYGLYKPMRGWPILVEETDRIPARVGTRFGLRIWAPFLVAAGYREVWTFPEMTNPETGEVPTEYTRMANVYSKRYAFTYKIQHPWQAVPGEWTFQLFAGNELIIERKFSLYDSECPSTGC